MALDFMAIVSYGAYPTPTPTGKERASFAVSFGLLSAVPDFMAPDGPFFAFFRRGFRRIVSIWGA